MADDAVADEEASKGKKSPLLIIGAGLAILLGGGSFYAVYSGMIHLPFMPQDDAGKPEMAETTGPEFTPGRHEEMADAVFVPLDPLVIALGPRAEASHLKLTVQIEADPAQADAVAALAPRILDVLNTLLRAIDETDVAEPHAMIRLRAQMLRRVQLVTPPGAVRDLLIQQFVLN